MDIAILTYVHHFAFLQIKHHINYSVPYLFILVVIPFGWILLIFLPGYIPMFHILNSCFADPVVSD